MLKRNWLYGVVMGLLLIVLEVFNYRSVVRNVSMEVYGVVIGIIFLALGIWVGSNILSPKQKARSLMAKPEEIDLSDREFEVLQLIAEGLSNQQIADQLFVSRNTIKTHISNIFAKLDVKRRTQAIQRAREVGMI
ncbi:MAG: response regulator transcription factor [Cyclobacteriaceae bacterium]